jgi:hypothetical protein
MAMSSTNRSSTGWAALTLMTGALRIMSRRSLMRARQLVLRSTISLPMSGGRKPPDHPGRVHRRCLADDQVSEDVLGEQTVAVATLYRGRPIGVVGDFDRHVVLADLVEEIPQGLVLVDQRVK